MPVATLDAPPQAMDYEGFFQDQIRGLKAEGRYRIFADLERSAGAFPRAVHHNPGASLFEGSYNVLIVVVFRQL